MNLLAPFHLSSRSALRVLTLLIMICLLMLLWPPSSSAQYVYFRLTEEDPDTRLYGDFAISPDGAHVVYGRQSRIHDTPRQFALYSVPITGGTPVRLNRKPVGEEKLLSFGFQISPDGKWVVYREIAGGEMLWSVPIGGGVPIPLAPLGEYVFNYAISPDSRYVVYSRPPAMFSVPITGGTPTLLTIPPAGQREKGGEDIYFEISPNGESVVFQEVGHDSIHDSRVFQLFSAPIGGGTPVEMETLPGYYGWERMIVTADSRHIVVERIYDGYRFALYSIPIEGGSPVRLSDDYELRLYTSLAGQEDFPLLSSDPGHVFYQRWDGSRKRDLLVSVPVSGGEPTELAVGEGPTQALHPVALASDGTHLIYSGYDYRGTFLYSTPISESAPVRLTPDPITSDRDIDISPDGSQVVYVTRDEVDDDEHDDDFFTLYRVPVTGGKATVLVQQYGEIEHVEISPDGSQVRYDSEEVDAEGSYIVPVLGGLPQLLPRPCWGSEFSPDGTRLVAEVYDRDIYVCTQGLQTHLPFMSRQ